MQEDWIGLVRRARKGDLDAFEALVERFKTPICAVVHPIVKDWHLTQDVAQEAFAAAWTGLGELRRSFHFRAYLYRVARNRAVSRIRSVRLARARRIETVEEEELRPLPSRPGRGGPWGGPRPTEAVLRRIRRIVMGLPNGYGPLLMMRYVEGMSIAEIAHVVERSEKAVKAVLYRARRTARSSLGRAGLTMETILDEV